MAHVTDERAEELRVRLGHVDWHDLADIVDTLADRDPTHYDGVTTNCPMCRAWADDPVPEPEHHEYCVWLRAQRLVGADS